MHSHQTLGQLLVQFDEYLFGKHRIGRYVAQTATEYYFAIVVNIGSLYYSVIELSVEAIAHFLSHLRKVTVKVMAIMGIDTLAQIGQILIRRTHVDGIGAGEHSVGMIAGRCAREDIDLKRTSSLMLALGSGSKRFGYYFG